MTAKLCAEISKLFLSGDKERSGELISATYRLSGCFVMKHPTLESLEPIMDLERKLLVVKGPNKQRIEQAIFDALTWAAGYCAGDDPLPECLPLTPALQKKTTDHQEKLIHQMALQLADFAGEMFRVKIARDSYNTKRKARALEIVGTLYRRYDFKEFKELCLSALQSNKKILICAVAEVLETRLGADKNFTLDPEIHECLENIVTKTKDRAVAVTALNVQVEAGIISEFGALAELDNWKERNYYDTDEY